MIQIDNLYKSFGKMEILKGISVEIETGKITAIAGPNGSGKTTLLKCILGLLRYEKGLIKVAGDDIQKSLNYKSNLGYVPQNSALPENLSIKEMAKMLMELRGTDDTRYEELKQLLKLENEEHKKSGSLSGGTKQKAGIVLGLMFNPQVIILDEPVSFLDPSASSRVKEEIMRLGAEGKTILYTSHNMSEIEEMADTLLYFLEGRIVYMGSPAKLIEETFSPNLEKAAAKLLRKHDESYSKNLKIYCA